MRLFTIIVGLISLSFSLQAKEPQQTSEQQVATFAGGCFWCMEPPFDNLDGVLKTTSGYAGGEKANPSYKEVASGRTKHLEAIQVTYDPQKVSYEELLFIFWRQINPTSPDGQFVDRGYQYSTAIFYHDEAQKKAAEASLEELKNLKKFDKPIVTPIRAFKNFYPAEDYHQDYYLKNPVRYKYYRWRSERDQFLNRIWGEDRPK